MSPASATHALTRAHVRRYFGHLERRDRDAAVAEVTRLLDRPIAPATIVVELLARAQREVGCRWQSGQWTVAQEHIASAITDAALHVIAQRAHVSDSAEPVAVACVEGEYHALPARMLSEVLRSHGMPVAFLGASLPVESVGPLLADLRPVAMALSCSISTHLLEAEAATSAAHEHGIPVLVGGAGFGASARWANALGADAWAASADGAVDIIRRWTNQRPTTNYPDRIIGEHHHIRLRQDELVALVLAALATAGGGEGRPPGVRRSQREAAASLVAMLAVALRLDEPGMLVEWAGSTLAVGPLTSAEVAAAAGTLTQALRDSPRAGEMLRPLVVDP